MPTYIVLGKYTEQGLKTIKESPSRLERVKQMVRQFGGELKSFNLTEGRYDTVTTLELPNDETAAKLSLAVGALGNVRLETLHAFTEEEFRKIVSSLP